MGSERVKVAQNGEECISCGACGANWAEAFPESAGDFTTQIGEEHWVGGGLSV
jgi:hypothetical protein